jgi:hypothetical protein
MELAGVQASPVLALLPAETSWRERLWSCPAETRLSVAELAEATGRPTSWIYRRTQDVTDAERRRADVRGSTIPQRIPHRREGGRLVFVVAEIRQYLRDVEDVCVPSRRAG